MDAEGVGHRVGHSWSKEDSSYDREYQDMVEIWAHEEDDMSAVLELQKIEHGK